VAETFRLKSVGGKALVVRALLRLVAVGGESPGGGNRARARDKRKGDARPGACRANRYQPSSLGSSDGPSSGSSDSSSGHPLALAQCSTAL
jgi:hypothetical protein